MELLKDFPIQDIIISEDFKNTTPGSRKMDRAEQRFQQIGKLPANIVINDENVLIDGYITYLLAVKYGIQRTDLYRGYTEVVEVVHYAGSNRMYMWRVPLRLVGEITEGDYIIVPTSRGAKRVKVTKVIGQQYPEQGRTLKPVYKICQRRGGYGETEKGQ